MNEKLSWWGWAAAIVGLLWAAESPNWRPVIVLFLVALILYNFDASISKGANSK